MKEEHPHKGYPQGGYSPPGVFPHGRYPTSGAMLQAESSPPGAPGAVLQDGKSPSGVTSQEGYPRPGALPQGEQPPKWALLQEGYPPPGASPQGFYPPQPGYVADAPTLPAPGSGFAGDLGEDGEVKGFVFSEKSIRRSFIRKVYAILLSQLLVTLSFISVFTFHNPIKLWVMEQLDFLVIAIIVTIVCVIPLACCECVRRKSPMNYIFLGIFTLAESFVLGVVSSANDTEVVMMAIGFTAAICLALTFFAMQTKFDFTVLSAGLFCALFVLCVFGLVVLFIPKNNIMILVYSSVGAFLFSLYLIYDTQLMIGGDHKYTISPEEYIFAALSLYLDIINLFIFILRIIAASR